MEAHIGQGRVMQQAGIELGLEKWIEFVSSMGKKAISFWGHRQKLHYVNERILKEVLGDSRGYMSGQAH